MFDYIQIASLVLYFLVLRWLASERIGPAQASAVVVLGSYVLSLIIGLILASDHDVGLLHMIGWTDLLRLLIQFVIGVVIFRQIQQRNGSYVAWAVWGLLGYYLMFIVAPILVTSLLAWTW